MRVMKFGGSSVRDAAAVRAVGRIIAEARQHEPVAVVVSAFAGVTDNLLEAADSALQSYDHAQEVFGGLHSRHVTTVEELIPAATRSRVMADIQVLFNNLEDVLHGVHLVRECSTSSRELIVSFGERLSAKILASYLATLDLPAEYVDSRPLILTKNKHRTRVVDLDESYRRMAEAIRPQESLPVMTGYLGSDDTGVTTTLGRNGSDYSATILGAALNADRVELWTDVDGIFSSDPNLIPDACIIDHMTFEEAQEMAYFGAQIVHPHALQPAIERGLSVVVRNTFNPEHPGTLIAANGSLPDQPVRGITTIDDVALVNVEGSGMIGLLGVAGRLFSALASKTVNVIMISQASSEHSICFVVRREEAERAVEAAREEFAAELDSRLIQHIEQLEGLAVLAIIGTRMRGTVGLSGKFFGALGNEGVNVVAISQGSSERNISIVVAEDEAKVALQAVHSAFGLDQRGADHAVA
jgi:aspartokinase/homoserine dehydrogenase 1